jgi:putative oxidoreductase
MLKDSTYLPFIGRVLIAVPFLLSGIGKIAAPAFTEGSIASVGLPMPLVAYAIAVVVEVGGSLLLLLGVKTGLTAVALAIFTLATAFAFHTNFADQNQMIHFLKNVIIVGGLLQVAAFGAGKFSVDAWLDHRRGTATGAARTRAVT